MSSFVQIMQLRTSKIDEIRAAVDEWQKATEGKRTVGRSAVCAGPRQPRSLRDHRLLRLLRRRHEEFGPSRDSRTLKEDNGSV